MDRGFPSLPIIVSTIYIAGCYDQAITCVTTEDVGTGVKKLLNEVCGWLFLLTTLVNKLHFFSDSLKLLKMSRVC